MNHLISTLRGWRVAALAAAFALSACGGGSGGSDSSGGFSPISVSIQAPAPANANNTVQVLGTASSGTTKLVSMAWTVSPSATLGNGTCASATRNSVTFGANIQNATGSSNWACPVNVSGPSGTATDTTYTLVLTATDEKGSSSSATQKLTFAASPAPAANTLVVNAGGDFKAQPGSTNPLHCSATGGVGPYAFQWVVSGNGGYNVTLASYTTADTAFTAPPVTASTLLAFTCRVTDSANVVSTGVVSAQIDPAAASTNTLVAQATAPATAQPGATVTLSSTGTGWFTPQGAATTGPAISYSWTTNTPGVTISNPTSASTTAVMPRTFTAPTQVAFTLTATGGGSTSTSTATTLVDPNGPLTVTVEPPSQVSPGSKALTIEAKVTGASPGSTLYYRWNQVSGPPVAIGGATTSKMGFVTPTVAANTTLVFRVSVGYSPITSTSPGDYQVDATVTATP